MCNVGVLVHGCHLQAANESWRDIVWGKPPDLLGRIPKGVHVAWRDTAVKIIIGTGASSLHGDREGTFTRNYLLNHLGVTGRPRAVTPCFSVIYGFLLCRKAATTSRHSTGRSMAIGVAE